MQSTADAPKLHTLPPMSPSHEREAAILAPLKQTSEQHRVRVENAMNSVFTDFPGSPFHNTDTLLCNVSNADVRSASPLCVTGGDARGR
eukprot:gene1915-2241_t